MTATLVAIQAGLGAAFAVGAFGPGRGSDPLASSAIVRRRTIAIRNVLEVVGGWSILRKIRLSRTTTTRLDRSGTERSEREVVASKTLLATMAMLAGSAIVGPVLGVPAGAVAWRVPDLVLARLARRTSAAADREIPVLLDLLAVATSAGLPPQLAFRRAVGPPPARSRTSSGRCSMRATWAVDGATS